MQAEHIAQLNNITFVANTWCISAVGCTNMIPPENAWLRRSNDDIIIGCYSSQQTWQLNCDGREWKGLVGTCPEMCKNYCAFCCRFQALLCILLQLLFVASVPRLTCRNHPAN